MQALLLIAHGSRREASNQEVRELAERLAGIGIDEVGLVVPAFLELAEPGILEGVDRCVAGGASSIRAVPYFLAAGRHVVTDIPDELAKARRRYPEIPIHQSEHLGKHACIPSLLLMLARGRDEPEGSCRRREPL